MPHPSPQFFAAGSSSDPKTLPDPLFGQDDVINRYSIDLFGTLDFSGDPGDRGSLTKNGKTHGFLTMAEEHGKPVILAETGPQKVETTLNQQDGINAWKERFVPCFQLMDENPVIKAFDFICPCF